MEITIESIVQRWSGLERPLFKGKLIDQDGCKCAQGDVLFCAGFTDQELREMEQSKADIETARVLGISRAHAVLLRQVNDSVGGAPQLVLSDPKQVLGDKAPLLLAFWLHLDQMTVAAWATAWDASWDVSRAAAKEAAWDAAGAAAWDVSRAASRASWGASRTAAWDVAWDAARAAARDAARAAAEDVALTAAWASSEIQGMERLELNGKHPYFLAFFGFKTWDQVRALVS